MKGNSIAVLFLAGSFLIAVSVQGATKGKPDRETPAKNEKAIAVLQPTEGNKARGIVTFTREGKGTKVVSVIEGLAAKERYGLRIDESGTCTPGGGGSPGGRVDPKGQDNLGDIETNAYGNVFQEAVSPGISLGGNGSILGRTVVVYAPPDAKTQPAGEAGARIACGVIRAGQK